MGRGWDVISSPLAQPFNAAVILVFWFNLRLRPYVISIKSEGSGETARMTYCQSDTELS